MRHKYRRFHTSGAAFSEKEVNPMEGLANLADAMLVLAVGIMLALVLHWGVEIMPVEEPPVNDEAVEFTEEDMQASQDDVSAEKDMEKMGTVYFDEETGKYYIVQEGN